jgi:hypothetical protein
MRLLLPTLILLFTSFTRCFSESQPPQQSAATSGSTNIAEEPLSYRDAKTGIIFYVESDGVHIVAISPKGKILWRRTPYDDYKAKIPEKSFIRVAPSAKITSIGRPTGWMIENRSGRYIEISFSSRPFGIMDVERGEFIPMGQD